MKVRERSQTSSLKTDRHREANDLDSQNDSQNLTQNGLEKFTFLFHKLLHPRWTISRKLGVSYVIALSVAAIGTIGGVLWGDYYEGRALEALKIANTQKFFLEDLDKNLSVLQTQPQKILRALGKPILTEFEQANFTLQVRLIQEQLSDLSAFVEANRDRQSIARDRYEEILKTYQQTTEDYQNSIFSLWQKMDAMQLVEEDIARVQQDILAFMQGEENHKLEIRIVRLSERLSRTIKIAERQRERATLQLARAKSLRLLIILTSIVGSGIVAAILAYTIGRAIALPLIRVRDIARQVTCEENFQLRAPAIADDEVGSLAHSLNQLIAWIGEYTQKQQEQIQLIQDEKMAGLSKMVGGVAHEINNPVGFIHGNLYYVKSYMQDLLGLVEIYQQEYPESNPIITRYMEEIEFDFLVGDTEKILNSMQEGTDRVRSIVKSLRNFSRLDESGKKAIDIHEGIESTLLILSSRIEQGIEVCKIYGDLPEIECYPAQLNQVFLNILTNSIDSLEEIQAEDSDFQPQIQILTERMDNNSIQIIINDNGKGIPSELHQKIFDPFFTTKPIGKGTGLGLSICYKIVEKHQGQIQVISEVDRGTKMLISLAISLSQNIKSVNNIAPPVPIS
ncbi:MAG: GHKL domain-containing protein [Cyanobacteria bacterium SBLK]|nr:GHKL domain-containing protein [Cyanobacteria bacterium SBLK]